MFKKLLSILFLTVPLFAQDITGTGTSLDPYILFNAADFDSIRYLGSRDKFYELANDIDFIGWGQFNNIDTATSIDGKGFKIKNMIGDPRDSYSSTTYNYRGGIFTYNFGVVNITIQNIIFEKCSMVIVSENIDDLDLVGFIAARGDGYFKFINITFDQCYLSYTDGAGENTGGANIGFIVGTCGGGGIFNSRILRSRMIINANDNSVCQGGLFSGGQGNLTAYFQKNYSYQNYLYVNNVGTGDCEFGFFSGGFASFGGCATNFTFEDTLECAGTTIIEFGALSHQISKGSIIGSNPILSQVYAARSVFINPTVDVKTDVFSVISASYTGHHDTTDYQSSYYPSLGRSTTDFLDSTLITGLNFTTTWKHSAVSSAFKGYPIFKTGTTPPDPLQTIVFLRPSLYEEILPGDSLFVSIKSENANSITTTYSTDNGDTWLPLRVDAISNETDTLEFYVTFTESDTLLLQATTDEDISDISNPFVVLSNKILNILSPTDSSGSFDVGDIVDIIVEVAAIDSLSLFYAVDDTTNWIPIALNLPVTYGYIDTITYQWTLPNIYGVIWIKALDVADTSLYVFDQPVAYIGGTMASQPMICWYDGGYFGGSSNWQSGSKTWITYCYIVDQSCGWGYYGTRSYGAWIDDLASGYYAHIYDPAGYIPASQIVANPFVPAPISIYNAIDTTTYPIGSFYEFGDTVTYKLRRYYVSAIDTTLRCDDLRNGIDSIFVADIKTVPTSLTPVFGEWQNSFIYGSLSNVKLQIYNVQRTKISGNFYPITQNFESLNDPEFEPVILFGGPSSNGRGSRVFKVLALDAPPDEDYIEDTQRIFTGLNITRDYFRGIDPKARKKNR